MKGDLLSGPSQRSGKAVHSLSVWGRGTLHTLEAPLGATLHFGIQGCNNSGYFKGDMEGYAGVI